MLLRRIEIRLLALTRHPLEAIPKEVAIVFFLCILGLVRVLALKVGMLGHIIDVVTIVLAPFVVPAAIGSVPIATISALAPATAFPMVSAALLIATVS